MLPGQLSSPAQLICNHRSIVTNNLAHLQNHKNEVIMHSNAPKKVTEACAARLLKVSANWKNRWQVKSEEVFWVKRIVLLYKKLLAQLVIKHRTGPFVSLHQMGCYLQMFYMERNSLHNITHNVNLRQIWWILVHCATVHMCNGIQFYGGDVQHMGLTQLTHQESVTLEFIS